MNVNRFVSWCAVGLIAVAIGMAQSPAQQKISKADRDAAQSILQAVATDIENHYYDRALHGINWDALVAETKMKIDQSESFEVALAHIAAAVDALNDSHTGFSPPRGVVNQPPQAAIRDWRALTPVASVHYDYGWRYQMIGERCFVTEVHPGSDAEKKELHVGDEIVSMNGYHPERATIQKADYIFGVLRPQPEFKLELIEPTGIHKQAKVAAEMRQIPMMSQYERGQRTINAYEDLEQFLKPRTAQFGNDLIVIKIPRFWFTLDTVQSLIGKARKHKSLILDLRDNSGGTQDALEFLLGGVFDREVKVADAVTRSERKPVMAKPFHRSFDGKLIVLIDSRSKSGAELFARVVQIEKRGIVMGDRSAGSVMRARLYSHQLSGAAVYYGASISEADLVMTDGNSLEHVGVTPDEFILPTVSDLAKGLDPVLAHAAESLGVKLNPEQAGKLFPYEWPPQ